MAKLAPLFFYLLIMCFLAHAQCPSILFSSKNQVCSNEKLIITNTSSGAVSYQWDLCSGELFNDPSIEEIIDINGSNIQGLSIINEDGNWYGFTTDRNGKKIYRLFFGSSLENSPSVTELNLNGATPNLAVTIQIVKDHDNWYGLIHDAANIIRVDIGSNLDNNDVTLVTVVAGIGANDDRLELKKDNGDWIAILAQNTSFSVINFGNDLTNIPNPITDIISSSSSGVARFLDLTLINDCGNWYGFAVGFSDRGFYRLEFGANLFSSPVITKLSSTVFQDRPVGVDIALHNGVFICFVQDFSGNFYRLELGNDLNNILITSASYLGFTNTGVVTGLSLVQNEVGQWMGMQVRNSGELYRVNFPNSCDANVEYSNLTSNPIVKYTTSGSYTVSLRGCDAEGNCSEYFQNIQVLSDNAHSVGFSVENNECQNIDMAFTSTFTSQPDRDPPTYSWSFDGGTTIGSTDPNPAHTFSQPGDSVVILTVDDGTCQNTAIDTVSIYPVPPKPTFSVETGPYCSNDEISVSNTTNDDAYEGATLTYTWLDGSTELVQGETADLVFDTDGNKNLTLKMSIPGCGTDSDPQVLNVVEGPNPSFSFENDCFGEIQEFSNLTTGSNLVNPSWDFGDGSGTSNINEPNYEYTGSGAYTVNLTMENIAGCVATESAEIFINGRPEVNFSPTTDCQGSIIPFEDESISGDAVNNIKSWDWDFGGLGSSDIENPNFIFESEGVYDVTLTVVNDGDCENTMTKQVQIEASPQTRLVKEPGCLDGVTLFEDKQSYPDGFIEFHRWEIQDAIYLSSKAGHTFTTPGVYDAILTVEAENGCQTIVNETVEIYDLPQAQFEVDNACDNQFAEFTDTSVVDDASGSPTIVSRVWDFDGENTSNGKIAYHNFNESGSYEVSLVVTDQRGCQDEIESNVDINQSPTSSFEVSDNFGVPPLTVDFTNQSKDAISYLWKFNDSENATSTNENTEFVYEDFGDFEAELISYSADGCADTSSVRITAVDPSLDLQLVSIVSKEESGLRYFDLEVRNNGNVDLIDFNVNINLDNGTRFIERYSGIVSRQSSVEYTLGVTLPLESNTSFLCARVDLIDDEDQNKTDNEGCVDFKQEVNVLPAYPNPSSGSPVRIDVLLPSQSPVTISLLNNSGRVIMTKTYESVETGLNSFYFETISFGKGIYIIKTSYDGVVDTQKWVKL
ncbi:PKD domain-containing protein [Reichenbachiella versicolor]|uniref:PKD domain-containing protein n=1 Tax=Reichenbachiella versicolor TaxID=1821036 RepID=UPI000D6E4136|nr:PKD domain-containing protein [Reichenbachiella versicolor]